MILMEILNIRSDDTEHWLIQPYATGIYVVYILFKVKIPTWRGACPYTFSFASSVWLFDAETSLCCSLPVCKSGLLVHFVLKTGKGGEIDSGVVLLEVGLLLVSMCRSSN